MVKYIDLLQNEVQSGDVLLELRMGHYRGCDYEYPMKLWEMPERFDGHGYLYSIDGSRHLFAWADAGSALKIDMSLMPEGFEYSFKHGMSDVWSKIKEGTLLELIENSNWKNLEIKKEQVDRFEFLKTLEINSIDDIKANIEELRKGGYIPPEIVSKVLKIGGVGRTLVHNGEIGIAGMHDDFKFVAIIESMD